MYKVDLVAPSVIIFSDIMVGGDEVQVQEGNAQDETRMLTDEDIKEIKEKVTKRRKLMLLWYY